LYPMKWRERHESRSSQEDREGFIRYEKHGLTGMINRFLKTNQNHHQARQAPGTLCQVRLEAYAAWLYKYA
jgi:hypothetical protein